MTPKRRSNQVLVVSADDPQRAQCREVLEGEGFSVKLAESRAEASRLLANDRVDVLIIDLFLHDGPAYLLFRERSLEGVLVIGLTGVLQGPTVRVLLRQRYPFVDLLDRPLQAAHLVDLLRVQLGDRYPAPPAISQVTEEDQASFDQEFFERRRVKTSHFHALDPSPDSYLGQSDLSTRPKAAAPSAGEPSKIPSILDVPMGLNWRKLPDQGELSVIAFAALITRLLRLQSSGALRLWRERVRKVVFFRKGIPIGVRSNLLYECLGRMLVRDGWIDESTCERAVQTSQQTKQRLGQTLVQGGVLTQPQLELVLRRQLKTRLLDVFSWDNAHYEWAPDDQTPEEVIHLRKDQVNRLIFKGVIRRVPLARVTRDLASQLHQQVKLLPDPEGLEALRLDEGQRAVLDVIQRRDQGTLLELIARFDEGTQTYPMIYGLATLGYLGFTGN